MNADYAQKKGIARDHLSLVTPSRSPEQLLDLELAEEFVALDIGDGSERPRRFYKISEGELYPLRVVARVIRDALGAEVSPSALFRALLRPIRRFIERACRQRLPRLHVHRRLRGGGLR